MRRLLLACTLSICALGAGAAAAPAAGPVSQTLIPFSAGDNVQWIVEHPSGGWLVSDWNSHRVFRVAADAQSASVFAGGGSAGTPYGDGGAPAAATLDQPTALAWRKDGSLLIADTEHHRIRLVEGSTIRTVAGTDDGFAGDNGAATSAKLSYPVDVAVLNDGKSFLIADGGNHRIRHVDGQTGIITTVAGDGFEDDDDGPRGTASFKFPQTLSLEKGGQSVLVADRVATTIRRVDLRANGEVTTVAGVPSLLTTPLSPWALAPVANWLGDGNPLTSPIGPGSVTALDDGSFLVFDSGNDRVRKVNAAGTSIQTLVGNGAAHGTAGAEGLLPTLTRLWSPSMGFVEADGDLVFVDAGYDRVRRVTGLGLARVMPGWAQVTDQTTNVPEVIKPAVRPVVTPPVTPAALRAPKENAAPAPPPTFGRTVSVEPAEGDVLVRVPGARTFDPLEAGNAIPVGSTVDARKGAVELSSAKPGGGPAQTATFNGGMFVVRQPRGSRGVTDLHLTGGSFAACPRTTRKRGVARAAAAKGRPVRRLWGSGKGRFRTHGRNAVATVRGTIWLTEDRCDGTRVQVRRGVVAVSPVRRGRTTLVRAGQSRLVRG